MATENWTADNIPSQQGQPVRQEKRKGKQQKFAFAQSGSPDLDRIRTIFWTN